MATEPNTSKMEGETAQTERDAVEYLQKHKIKELMDNLISMLFYYRPDDPYVFLHEQLEKLKICQQTDEKGPSLLNNSNLETAFAILDPAEQKFITFAQYKQALTTLDLRGFNECPEGVNEDKISQETFSIEALEGLRRCSATYGPLECKAPDVDTVQCTADTSEIELQTETIQSMDDTSESELQTETIQGMADTSEGELQTETIQFMDDASEGELQTETIQLMDDASIGEPETETIQFKADTSEGEPETETIQIMADTSEGEPETETIQFMADNSESELQTDTVS